MTDRTCTVDGCGKPVLARGLCTAHYQRWRSTGDLRIGKPIRIPRPRTVDGLCSVDGCGKPFFARGWCAAHYTRLSRHGSLNNPGVRANAPGGTKWCPRCKAYKSTDEFYACRSAPSGCQPYCKLCDADNKRQRRRNGKDVSSEQAASRRRRALQRQALSEPYTAQEIAERDGWVCQICRKRIGRKFKWPHPRSLSIDHIIPISKGGDDVRANVNASHLTCNRSKYTGGTDQLRLIG